ncbi:MAG: class I SAM-dependent RNA methyltransferase [Planctomycetota bacterium]|jgi:23S rRNA (uracil1939-C5)-methyltransferase
MQRPFSEGDVLELTPMRLGKRGEAEAEFEGWRVRIPGAIPGEKARVTLLHVSKGGQVARAQYDGPAGEPDAARRTPPCAIHEECGGCGLQQITAARALEFKVAQAEELLGVGLQAPIESPSEFGYRARTFLLPQGRKDRLIMGARPRRGPRLVDTTGCAVLRPELEALAARVRAVFLRRTDETYHLRAALLRCNRAGETQLTIVHRGYADWLEEAAQAAGATAAFIQKHEEPGNSVHSDEHEVMVAGESPISERYGEIEAMVPPTAFMQGNPEVAEALYERVAAAIETSGTIAELYCGGAVAGLTALRRNPEARLVGLDRAPRAITAAHKNARHNGLHERCRFRASDAAQADGDWDVALVNPPRAGCDPAVLDAVANSRAQRLVYLSCSPATLARDIEHLGWKATSVTPADMFPQTPHLELLAILDR